MPQSPAHIWGEMRIDLDRAAGGYRSRPTARQQRSAPAAPGHRSCCESVQQHHLSAVPQMKARGARSNTCAPSPSITALGHPSPCFLLICCCRPSSARATRTEHPFLRPVRPSSRQPLARPDRRLWIVCRRQRCSRSVRVRCGVPAAGAAFVVLCQISRPVAIQPARSVGSPLQSAPGSWFSILDG